jgi:hypothetical protein
LKPHFSSERWGFCLSTQIKEPYMANAKDREIGFRHGETGVVLMLNKKERILVKEVLSKTFSSKEAKEVIKRKFGEEYIEIGYRLLKILSGSKL